MATRVLPVGVRVRRAPTNPPRACCWWPPRNFRTRISGAPWFISVAHGEEGSAGLVLNRRTETAVHLVLPGWVPHTAKPQAVYAGGPVQPSGAMCLGVSRGGYFPGEGFGLVRVAGRVVLVDLDSEPATAAATLTGVRIFAGHAGWGEGQLAAEIAEGAWFVVPGLDNDILAGPMVDLYFRSLKRQGFPLAWEAYRPADLERN